MERKNNRRGVSWSRGLRGVSLAAALLLAPGAEARDLLAAPGELIYAEAQTCQVECGQALARCERLRERGKHCPREFQSCKERCSGANRESTATGRERRQLLCVHRCETSAGLCEQNNPKNRESCRVGAASCRERCG